MTQTVGFVAVTLGDPDANGVRERIRAQVDVEVDRFRPLSVTEKNGLFNIAADVWKCTVIDPPAAVLAADDISELVYDGTSSPARATETVWQVISGSQPFTDFSPEVFKVTVLAERQKG